MNQKFEELKLRAVREADVSHIDFDNMSQTDIRILGDIAVEKKFAELIVRECAQVAHNKQYKHSPAHTVGDCATAIREHFGVE